MFYYPAFYREGITARSFLFNGELFAFYDPLKKVITLSVIRENIPVHKVLNNATVEISCFRGLLVYDRDYRHAFAGGEGDLLEFDSRLLLQ